MEDKDSALRRLQAIWALIPLYMLDGAQKLEGPPQDWQRNVLAYSFYIGLGLGSMDRPFATELAVGISGATEKTSDMYLNGLRAIEEMPRSTLGELWDHAVDSINNFASLSSSETIGPNSNMELVVQRMPMAGFIPGMRIALENLQYGRRLIADAAEDQKDCDESELKGRVEWLKVASEQVLQEAGGRRQRSLRSKGSISKTASRCGEISWKERSAFATVPIYRR